VKEPRLNEFRAKRSTIVGHFAADLLFNNDKYDPYTGHFEPGAVINKFDPPQEFMDMVVKKAMQLDAQLRAAGIKS
jgi:hypothetical protein